MHNYVYNTHCVCLGVCIHIQVYVVYTISTFLCQHHWLRSEANPKPAWQNHKTNTIRQDSLIVDIS